MPKYHIRYAMMDDLQPDESLQAGWGEIDITTDLPIETEQQMYEVSKQIGHQTGATRVGILKIEELDEDIEVDEE